MPHEILPAPATWARDALSAKAPPVPEHPADSTGESTPLGSTPYIEDGKFVPSRLGSALKAAGHLRYGTDQHLWRYVDGVYRPDGHAWVAEQVRDVLEERWRSGHLDQVIRWLESGHRESVAEMSDPRYLNVRNGLLDWRTGELLPHTPDVVSTVQLHAEWDPSADPVQAGKFLKDVLGEEMIPFAAEMIGYALHPEGNVLRKAFLFYGSGANGKSKLLALITSLIGTESASSVTLEALTETRFSAAELYGAQVNVAGDIDATPVRHPGVLKSLTGGDLVSAERKFRDPFQFRVRAIPFFSCNEYPPSVDTTPAWFDRWVVVPFTRRFSGTDADPDILARITTAHERSGLLRVAVDGLRRLMDRGAFDLPDPVQGAMADYRRRTDGVAAFVEEECAVDPDAPPVYRTHLYKGYVDYMQEQNLHPLAARRFYAKLEQDYGIGQRKIGGLDHLYGIAFSTRLAA